MADDADQAKAQEEVALAATISTLRAKAEIPTGIPGECEHCLVEVKRLVKGACAPCRDRLKLP